MYYGNYLNWLQFPNSKKNSFQGNYMRKYSTYSSLVLLLLLSKDPNYFEELTWNLIILFLFTLHLVWIHYLKVRVREIRGKPRIKTLLPFRCSTSVLVFGCLLMNHVIYLKLRQKQLFLKADQIHKMTTLFTQNDDFFFKPDHFE